MTASIAGERISEASGIVAEGVNANASSALDARIAAILTLGALPGETDGFDEDACTAAATFIAAAAARRPAGQANVALESGGGEGARRSMRLAIINDDMPFLV